MTYNVNAIQKPFLIPKADTLTDKVKTYRQCNPQNI